MVAPQVEGRILTVQERLQRQLSGNATSLQPELDSLLAGEDAPPE